MGRRVAPVALLLAMGGSASAQAPEPAPPESPAEVAASAEGTAETARSIVRSFTEWLAEGVDSWFGDKPFAEGGKVSNGRLDVTLLSRQHQALDVNVRFNARFTLPNLQDRIYLFVGRDDPRDVVSDKPGALSRQQQVLRENGADNSFFAGLGLRLQDAVDFRLGLRGGLKPYAQARYERPFQLDSINLVDFRQTVYWGSDERFGSTTVVSYEHVFSPTLTGRWISAATITQRSKTFEWSSIAGAYRSFGDQRLLSLEAIVNGVQDAGYPVSDCGLQAKWEQPIHKDWLLGEVLLGHFWPRVDAQSERLRAWAVGVGVKMKF